jgi:hypothetical protein
MPLKKFHFSEDQKTTYFCKDLYFSLPEISFFTSKAIFQSALALWFFYSDFYIPSAFLLFLIWFRMALVWTQTLLQKYFENCPKTLASASF